MDIYTCCKKYGVEHAWYESPRLTLQIASPGTDLFFEVDAMFDSGASGLVLPIELFEMLDLPSLGQAGSATSGGLVKEIISEIDLKVVCIPSGRPIMMRGVSVTVSELPNQPLLVGAIFFNLFSVHIRRGVAVSFEFDDRAIQSKS